MSKPHAITDEAILAAWTNGERLMEHLPWRARQVASQLRELVESTAEGPATIMVGDMEDPVDVTALRDRLGGWDAVWRAVLADEGFVGCHGTWLPPPGVPGFLRVTKFDAEWLLGVLGQWQKLRSPADLRVRVGHARGLFGEGT